MKVADRKRNIYKVLADPKIKTVVLHGKAGVGKTWTAREVGHIAKQCGLFDIVLWVYLNREYDDDTLRDCIAQQLFPLYTCGDDSKKKDVLKRIEKIKLLIVLDDEGSKMNELKASELLNNLLGLDSKNYKVVVTTRDDPIEVKDGRKHFKVEPMIREESLYLLIERASSDDDQVKRIINTLAADFLQRAEDIPNAVIMIAKTFKYFLFDDEGSKSKEEKVWELLNNLLKLNPKAYQVLVITRNDPTDVAITREESLYLLVERAFSRDQAEGINNLAADFLQRTEDMPHAIILMAKAFKYFLFDKEEKGGMAMLRRSLEEPSDSKKIYNITDLLRIGYDLVPYNIIIDCQRDAKEKEKPLFNNSRCIDHNELIAYWMMEGYLGPVSCMETVYRKGHEILMELLDFQILKRVEADCVTINPQNVYLPNIEKNPLREEFDNFIFRKANNYYRRGYYAIACLGLDSVFDSVAWKGFVRILPKGGVMRTLAGGKDGEKVSVLLLDGNSLAKELPSKFTSSLKELQVLAIFNPTESMLFSFSDKIISLLHVFVLRSCLFMDMDQVYGIKSFKNLTVLEISGPFGLFRNFPEAFFKRMPKLQSLNLSSLPFTSLPPSVYELGELKWLILRDCTSLTTLGSLKYCKNLMVLDCSGSTSLVDVHDRTLVNTNLEMINLSSTKIKTLPLLTNLGKLTHLLLSKCTSMIRLPGISNMVSLEVIDLSNSSCFCEFLDQSLVNLVMLKVLDLSGTGVSLLPDNIGNPRHLFLESCTQLRGEQVLNCLAKVTDLERFVLSDAAIQSLPPLSHLTNLRQLSVTGCLDLEAVPDLSSLEKMEELDFSGCKSIKSLLYKTFDKMCHLQNLNLSGTCIESLPSLANLSNLRRLLLKDCKELKTLPSLESSKSLEKLEELNVSGCKALENIEGNFFDWAFNLHTLDLSDTLLKKLPSLSKLEDLRELHLRNCKGLECVPDLETLTTLEILDLSGSAVSTLPVLSSLRKLRQLMLNNCSALSLFQEMATLSVLGNSVQDLPYGISELTSLEILDLPCMDFLQENETKTVEAKSDGCEWGISSLSAPKEKISPLLWESILKKFHLCVYPIKELEAKNVVNFHHDDFVYRDIYLQNRHISGSDDQRLLEIYGFSGYKPRGIDKVFSHANQILFVDSKFRVLSSFLIACDFKQMKGCWIEKSGELEVIFSEKDIAHFNSQKSDKRPATAKKYTTKRQAKAIQMSEIHSKPNSVSRWIPRVLNHPQGNLDISTPSPVIAKKSQAGEELKAIETVVATDTSSPPPPHPEPAMFTFCATSSSKQNVSKALPTQGSESLLNSLETLWVSNAMSLKSIFEIPQDGKEIPIHNVFQNLEKLYLECCPKLTNVLSLFQMPQKLKILQIKFCDKLEKVFYLTSQQTKLQYLDTLHLWDLPELKSIGCQKLPSLKTLKISNCPNLQDLEETIRSAESLKNLSISNVCDLERIDVSKELKYLSIESCPNLLEICTTFQPPSDVEIHIRFCNNLETLFEKGASLELKKLCLHGLPKLRSIGATLPIQANYFIVDCLNFEE